MKNSKIIGIILVVALLAIGWYALPYITVAQMQKAAVQQDAAALSAHIDFVALRQNLKDQINAAMLKEMPTQTEDNPFAAIGTAFADVLVNKMVDAYITPSALTQIMRGASALGTSSDSQRSNNNKPFDNAVLAYESLNQFSVSVKDAKSDKTITFVLNRSGLSWKLSEIRLPI